MAGIVQEQHPERTRLFMQWKQMNWPVMVDSLNLLGVSGVPTTLLIDEAGIIQAVQPDEAEFDSFLAAPAPPQTQAGRSEIAGVDFSSLEQSAREGDFQAQLALADALYLWRKDQESLTRALGLYSSLLEKEPKRGYLHFRMGVVYKTRSELTGSSEDFRAAVSAWTTALDLNPNQYIWRRRIQQYGPRLDKPYSFYDWIHQARSEISDRGETPVDLTVEPGGAEFAYPADEITAGSAGTEENPDPDGRIFRDREGLIQAEQIIVPDTSRGNRVARVHLEFRPNPALKAHWNNEAGNMILWVDPPKGWKVDSRRMEYQIPPRPVSSEKRSFEFELHGPADFQGTARGEAFALYYVCEDVDGTCLYRRQDIPIELKVD